MNLWLHPTSRYVKKSPKGFKHAPYSPAPDALQAPYAIMVPDAPPPPPGVTREQSLLPSLDASVATATAPAVAEGLRVPGATDATAPPPPYIAAITVPSSQPDIAAEQDDGYGDEDGERYVQDIPDYALGGDHAGSLNLSSGGGPAHAVVANGTVDSAIPLYEQVRPSVRPTQRNARGGVHSLDAHTPLHLHSPLSPLLARSLTCKLNELASATSTSSDSVIPITCER
jgi:hypothetical protein